MAKDLGYKGQFETGDGGVITFHLTLVQFKDDGVVIIYAPAFDVYGYGYNEEEAKQSFNICLEEFLNETSKKKVLVEELEKLGWKFKDNKSAPYEPSFTELINRNKELQNIMENISVTTKHEERNFRALT